MTIIGVFSISAPSVLAQQIDVVVPLSACNQNIEFNAIRPDEATELQVDFALGASITTYFENTGSPHQVQFERLLTASAGLVISTANGPRRASNNTSIIHDSYQGVVSSPDGILDFSGDSGMSTTYEAVGTQIHSDTYPVNSDVIELEIRLLNCGSRFDGQISNSTFGIQTQYCALLSLEFN